MIRGINTGGGKADYYDNPNYDPKNEGKSKGDKALQNKAKSLAGLAVDEVIDIDKQNESTVSYFRNKEKERLNVNNPGAGTPQINPEFSKPASLDDKLAKFGFSFDPEDPDNYYGRQPEAELSTDTFRTDRTYTRIPGPGVDSGSYTVYEDTIKYQKGDPMPNTVSGVNQELQARKARTRDFAMEFRGTVYDYIGEVRASMLDEIDNEMDEYLNRDEPDFRYEPRQPLKYGELEDKFFPDDQSKKAAKKELRKIVAFTDDASEINREYSSLNQLAETALRAGIGSSPIPFGIDDGGSQVNDKLTAKNFEKSVESFNQWKSKKGVPKIVRLISKLG